MFKIHSSIILLITCILQITLSWADNNRWINLVYIPDAQLDNNQIPAYSFKMDPAEKVPYLATIIRDENIIQLDKLIYYSTSTNISWALQTIAPQIIISKNSYKVRLALAPNEEDATTTPYIAYIDGTENTLHVFQAQRTGQNYSSWKEIPINLSNIRDLDMVPTNNGVDIAVMDSNAKVNLYKITKNGELSCLINSDVQVPAIYIPNYGEEKYAIKLVVSSASGTETPYLVFLKNSGTASHSAPLVNFMIWTPNGSEWSLFKQGQQFKTSAYWSNNMMFDAIPCKYGICANASSSPGMGWGSEGPVSDAFVTSSGEEKFILGDTSTVAGDTRYVITPYSSIATDGNSIYSYGFEFTYNDIHSDPTHYAVNSYKFNHDAGQWEYTGATAGYSPNNFIIPAMFVSPVMYPLDSQKHFIGFIITMYYGTKDKYVIEGQYY